MFLDDFFHHYYMKRLIFYDLIKHMFKINLQKDKISFVKDSILRHIETLALNAA